MIPVLLFAGIGAALALCLHFAAGLGLSAALLWGLGLFVLLHLLCPLFVWLFSLSVPTGRPLEKQHPLCRAIIGPGSSVINFYAGVRPVITGAEKLPKEGRFLFISNHRSMYDPLVVMDRLRDYNISFISKPSNLKIPLAGRIAYAAGYLPIDRENDRNALKTILTAADYMKRDLCSIAIYPEGTRSRTNEMLPFHAGSFKTAQRAKVPIVVASVHGSEKVKRAKFLSATRVFLDILEVIPAETVCSMRTDALAARVREMIQQDLDAAEKRMMELTDTGLTVMEDAP